MDNLANLVVRLLFDDSQFQVGLAASEAEIKTTQKRLLASQVAAGKAASDLAGRVSQAVSGAIVGAFQLATLAVGGFVAASIGIGARFDKEIRTVGAILGEGEEAFQRVSDEARRLGATTQFTATQAATALQNFARAGLTAAESVAAAGPALDLATAAASSLDQATASLAATLAQFRLGAEQSSRVADVLANAASRTKFSLEGLTVALRQAGPAGASVGLSLEETVAAVSQFRNIGLEASQAGTIFRSSLTRLVNPSGKATAALERLGLTLDDVDPTKVKFDELLVRIRDAGAGTREFTQIFGRFGLQVQSVAASVDQGTSSFRTLADTFAAETGRASAIAEEQRLNVLTQLTILGSAIQEVFLQVFDALRGPLLTVFEGLNEVITEVGERFGDASDTIENQLGKAADAISSFLKNNASAFADLFVQIALAVTSLVDVMPSLLTALDAVAVPIRVIVGLIADNLKLVVLGGAVVLITLQLASFASALVGVASNLAIIATTAGTTVPIAMAAASASVQAFAVVLVTTTGGLAAIAIAIGAVVAGLIVLTARTREAARAQRDLTAEREAGTNEREAQIRDQERLAELLRIEKEEARAVLNSKQDLTDERERELKQILALNAASVQSRLATGELIETAGGLEFAAAAVREFGEDGVTFLRGVGEESAATAEALASIGPRLRALADEAGDIDAGLGVTNEEELARSIINRVNRVLTESSAGIADLAIDFDDIVARAAESGDSILAAADQAATVAAEQAEIRRERQAKQAEALLDKTAILARDSQEAQTAVVEVETDKRIGLSDDETEARDEAAKEQEKIAERAAKARIKLAEDAAKAIASILARERAEQIKLLPSPDQTRVETAALLAELNSSTAQLVDNFNGTQDELAAIIERATDARRLIIERANRTLLHQQETADEGVIALHMSRARIVGDIVGGEVSAIEQLRRKAASNIEQIERLAAEEQKNIRDGILADLGLDPSRDARVQAEQEIADLITGIDQELAEQILAIFEELDRKRKELLPDGSQTREFVGVIEDLATAGKILADQFSRARSVLSDIADQAVGIIDTFSGGLIGGFDVSGIIGDVASGVADAAEQLEKVRDEFARGESTVEDVRQAEADLQEAQAGLTDGSTATAITNQFLDGIVAFVDAMASSVDNILTTFADRLPEILQSIADAIPKVLAAVADALPGIITTIAASLGPIIESLISGLSDVIQGLLAELPTIITEILGAIPGIIQTVAAELPVIITALVDAIGPVIQAIADAIPAIVVALAEAIPTIVIALADAIPQVIQAAIAGVSSIQTALIGAMPDVMNALIAQLPSLITAGITFIPKIIAAFVIEIPKAAIAFVKVIFEKVIPRLPEIALNLIRAIVVSIAKIFISFVDIFAKIIKAALTPFRKLLTKEGRKEAKSNKAGRQDARQARKASNAGGGQGLFQNEEGRGFFQQIGDSLGSIGGSQGGDDFITRTVARVVHPGEAILTAQENRARLFNSQGSSTMSPTSGAGSSGAPAFAAAARGAVGGGSTIVINNIVGGMDMDTVTVALDQAGQRVSTNRLSRRKSGTRVGLERRR